MSEAAGPADPRTKRRRAAQRRRHRDQAPPANAAVPMPLPARAVRQDMPALQAPDRLESQVTVVAERIARTHNAFLAAFRDGGRLVFSEQACAVEPAGPPEADWQVDPERLPFPIADRPVTIEEVEAWLARHRELQAEVVEARQRAQEEARARNSIRVGERQRNYGMAAGAVNCSSCGAFKSAPSARCTQCGDEPVTHNGDPREFDRAHGRAA